MQLRLTALSLQSITHIDIACSMRLACLLLSTSLLMADFVPWFTGSILSLPGHVVGDKHTNWQPYLYITDDYGTYDTKWRRQTTPSTSVVNPQLLVTRGFGDWFDIKIEPQMLIKTRSNHTSARLGDFPVVLGFQALNQKGWIPDLRIILRETFPSGQYDHLNPKNRGTDSTGSGSYQTTLGFNFQMLNHLWGHHYLRSRLNLVYTVPSPVHVHGFNTYGGGFGTNGTVYPGNHCFAIYAFEFNFNQNWVLAMDIMGSYNNRTRFSGKRGVNQLGQAASNTPASASNWSLCPAIEYNWSKNLGFIGGIWFSVAGRNSEDFISYVISFNYFQ